MRSRHILPLIRPAVIGAVVALWFTTCTCHVVVLSKIIPNLVVHQRRSPLPCRRSILLRRSASLHRSRTAAPGGARGLALLRNPQGCHRGLSVSFFFLSGFSFSFVFFFVFFETPRLRSQKKERKPWGKRTEEKRSII